LTTVRDVMERKRKRERALYAR